MGEAEALEAKTAQIRNGRKHSVTSTSSSQNGIPDDSSENSGSYRATARLRRWRSAGALTASRSAFADSGSYHIPHVEKDAHEMRPPSPLSRLDYGGISQR